MPQSEKRRALPPGFVDGYDQGESGIDAAYLFVNCICPTGMPVTFAELSCTPKPRQPIHFRFPTSVHTVGRRLCAGDQRPFLPLEILFMTP